MSDHRQQPGTEHTTADAVVSNEISIRSGNATASEAAAVVAVVAAALEELRSEGEAVHPGQQHRWSRSAGSRRHP